MTKRFWCIHAPIWALILCAGAVAFAQAGDQSPPVVSSVHFVFPENCPDRTKLRRMAEMVNYISEGEPFSERNLKATIRALQISRSFSNIDVQEKAAEGDNRISLWFTLTPHQRIAKIKIKDAAPLFNKEVLNAMTIYVGDVFIEKTLDKQIQMIEEIYRRQGFINPKASISVESVEDENTVILIIDIDKGAYWNIKRLDIKGNDTFFNARLKLKMKTATAALLPGESGRFIESKLKKDIRELTEFYKAKRYADVKIESDVKKDPDTNLVYISVSIDEGPRYNLEFEGNEEFWTYTLKKNIVLFKNGLSGNRGILKSIRNMKTRYADEGYENARITYETSLSEDKNEKTVRFAIDEGGRAIVKSCTIQGNEYFSTERIKKEVLTRMPGMVGDGAFVQDKLREDIVAIRSLYLKNGFMNAEVKENVEWSEDRRMADVTINIKEGKQTLIENVGIEWENSDDDGLPTKQEIAGIIQLKKNDPFREYMIKSDENAICSAISEKGRPHVTAEGKIEWNDDRSKASIVYHINPGPFVKMGRVFFNGNFKTRESIIRNELEIEPGSPFSLVNMLETQRNIRNMDVFDSVQFRTAGLKEKSDIVHLFVDLEEQKPYFLQFSGGYDTEKNAYVSAKAGDGNLFGRNISAWTSGEISEIGYRGDIGFTEPRLMGYRISCSGSVFTEREEAFNKDFGVLTTGASLGFGKKWLSTISTGLTFQYEWRDQFLRDSVKEPDDPSEYEPRSILIVTPSIQLDTRDSFVNPKKGIYSMFTVGVHKGMENTLDDFLKYKLDLRTYWSPFEHLTFAVRGYAGYINSFGATPDVPDDQLFFLGGTTDVRGFKENMLVYDENGDPVGGRTAVYSSLETRIDLGIGFELAVFYDVGSVYDSFKLDLERDFRSSVGMGIRYITPIGPIGFLYGFKLNPKKTEGASRLHFSLGYTF